VSADVVGNKRGILILTMSTKPTLSFLLLITLTLLLSTLALILSLTDKERRAGSSNPPPV